MNVAVVGGGLAGLSAAHELSGLGHRVTLFERRRWCGGKTYSYVDHETGEQVDNGQHVFMGCTTEYTAFLRRLGTIGLTRRQRRLSVPVFDEAGRRSRLWSQRLPAPLHLGLSFALYRHLTLADKVRIGRVLLRVHRMSEEARLALSGVPFGAWLRDHGQSWRAIRDFWDFMLVPTLNCRSNAASTADALFVLREGFLKSSTSATVGVPAVGLTRLHVEPAVEQLRERGGEVRTGTTVVSLAVRDVNVDGLSLADGTWERYDAYICATPHTKVAALFSGADREPFARLCEIPTAPIINLHFWFDRPVAEFAFAAFIGSELQWVFNRDRLDSETTGERHHIVVSLSAAEGYMPLDKADLQERFLPQLRAALPMARDAELLKFHAVKEPEATFVPAPGVQRPGNVTHLTNLWLAGAYTDTGWPATMESAVRSGLGAARALHVHFNTQQEAARSGRRR